MSEDRALQTIRVSLRFSIRIGGYLLLLACFSSTKRLLPIATHKRFKQPHVRGSVCASTMPILLSRVNRFRRAKQYSLAQCDDAVVRYS